MARPLFKVGLGLDQIHWKRTNPKNLDFTKEQYKNIKEEYNPEKNKQEEFKERQDQNTNAEIKEHFIKALEKQEKKFNEFRQRIQGIKNKIPPDHEFCKNPTVIVVERELAGTIEHLGRLKKVIKDHPFSGLAQIRASESMLGWIEKNHKKAVGDWSMATLKLKKSEMLKNSQKSSEEKEKPPQKTSGEAITHGKVISTDELKALVLDLQIKTQWPLPTLLPLLQQVLSEGLEKKKTPPPAEKNYWPG